MNEVKMSKRWRPHRDVRAFTKAYAQAKREEARQALVEALEANFSVPKHLHPTSRPIGTLAPPVLGYATHKPWKAGYSFNDPSNLHRHPDYYQGDKRVIKPLKSS